MAGLAVASVVVACAACTRAGDPASAATAAPPAATEHPAVAATGGTSSPSTSSPGTSSPGTLPDGFVALTDAPSQRVYAAAIAKVGEPLPTGLAYPSGVPAGLLPQDPQRPVLREGAARDQVFFTWLCAWEGEYLGAEEARSADRQAEATAKLTWWSTGWFYTQVEQDPDHGWIANVLAPLQRGDSSGVRAEHATTCRAYPTTTS